MSRISISIAILPSRTEARPKALGRCSTSRPVGIESGWVGGTDGQMHCTEDKHVKARDARLKNAVSTALLWLEDGLNSRAVPFLLA